MSVLSVHLKKSQPVLGGLAAPNIVKEGVLQRFEFTHELAWKTLKDYLEYEGHQNITGSRTAVRLAFNLGLLEDGNYGWI